MMGLKESIIWTVIKRVVYYDGQSCVISVSFIIITYCILGEFKKDH